MSRLEAALWAWLETQPELKERDQAKLLKRMLDEQFEIREGKLQMRVAQLAGCLQNPHDPEAQWSSKDPEKKSQWIGYKVQVMETVGEGVVSPHHDYLQQRRREMGSEAFQREARHRNAIEGTISELVRGYGLRKTRYRGLAKTRLGNYFIAAACNIRRWGQQIAWQVQLASAEAA